MALAAVKLAHEATGAGPEEEEIPDVAPRPEAGGARSPSPSKRGRAKGGGMTRLFVGAGRAAGIRPQDLVGAITGESSLSGRDIGGIEIADRFSLVEVPEATADEVIKALRGTTLKGRKATVRRERYSGA